MPNRTTVLLILAVMLLISSCSPTVSVKTSDPTTASDGVTLVQERCSRCHPLARVERSRHTTDEWKTIVDSMISRGAKLTPEEETAVVNYLGENFGK